MTRPCPDIRFETVAFIPHRPPHTGHSSPRHYHQLPCSEFCITLPIASFCWRVSSMRTGAVACLPNSWISQRLAHGWQTEYWLNKVEAEMATENVHSSVCPDRRRLLEARTEAWPQGKDQPGGPELCCPLCLQEPADFSSWAPPALPQTQAPSCFLLPAPTVALL